MPEQSIFEYIANSIVNGVLPPNFNLDPYEKDEQDIRFADGAADGITIIHTAPPDLPDSLSNDIDRGITQACSGDYEAANETFGKICEEYRAVAIIDEVQRCVMERSGEINAEALWVYAVYLLGSSTDKELVKIGLVLLELFGDTDDEVKETIRILGRSDEFTLFAAWCARSWADGNEELFRLAQSVHGWGRIHTVQMLEPATDEIADWLLYEGIHNTVLPQYSALACYVKADVSERLADDALSHDDFSAISSIVHAALSDSPAAGLSALEDPKGELERYIRQAARQQLDPDDRECLEAVADYADDHGWADLASEFRALL